MKAPDEQVYGPLRDFFDRAAADWDERVVVRPAFLRRVVGAARLRPGDTVLDVGCGTGVLVPYLRERVGEEGCVWALDISPAMLERARRRYPQATYLCAPAEAIPLPPGCCRAVICYSAFPHFPDQARAVAEMARVLAPGGRLVVAHAESREEINALHRRLGGLVAHHLLPDDATMRYLLERCGLETLRFTDGPRGYLVVARRGGACAASARYNGGGREAGTLEGTELVRARVYVSGRVQGVFFRATTREQADRLGVAGWVRNLPDGRVEAVFEGARPAVEACLDWCRTGPPGARVAGVEVEWEPPRGERGFRIR